MKIVLNGKYVDYNKAHRGGRLNVVQINTTRFKAPNL